MATDLEAVFTALAVLERTITGVKAAHDKTPEKLIDLPAFINFPSRGETIFGPWHQMEGYYTIIAELHVARANLPIAETVARPFLNRFEDLLSNDVTISGTVETINALRSSYGTLTYGIGTDAVAHLGWRFEIDIKIRRNI